MAPPTATHRARVLAVERGGARNRLDEVATEEPLEVRLRASAAPPPRGRPLPVRQAGGAGPQRTVAVTMRTPGSDFELAAGFLFNEGVVRRREEIARIGYCDGEELEGEQQANIVSVDLQQSRLPELPSLDRHFFGNSACGVCGKASLETLRVRTDGTIPPGPVWSASALLALPERLAEAQGVFSATGGLHAAALFDGEGRFLAAREDVGRHNAVDKLVGWAFLEGRLPLHGHLVMVSGRSSFEIVQKCVMAGVPVLCAVSAPSSLAITVAEEFGVTLVGFLRGDRFNVYSAPERIRA